MHKIKIKSLRVSVTMTPQAFLKFNSICSWEIGTCNGACSDLVIQIGDLLFEFDVVRNNN